MAVTLPPAAKADILRRLAGAIVSDGSERGPLTVATRDELADEYGLLNDEIRNIVTKHGWPKPDSMRRAADLLVNPKPVVAAGPTPTAAGFAVFNPASMTTRANAGHAYQQLLEEAAKSSKVRTRNLGVKIAGLVADLAQLVAEEAVSLREAAEAERRKAEARAEVERLERELAEAKAKLTGKPPTQGGQIDTPSPAEIRAWAQQNGVECTRTGIVPKAVRAAYDAAHADQDVAS